MKHPDPDRIREVMRSIIDVRRSYPTIINQIDMQSTRAPDCGTPGCHAGDLMLGMLNLGMDTLRPTGKDRTEPVVYDFDDSAGYFSLYIFHRPLHEFQLSSQALEYETAELETWAEEYPELWGNREGLKMFSDGSAFGQDTDLFSPEIITDHWLAVADRIEVALVDDLSHAAALLDDLIQAATINPALTPPMK